MIDNYTLQHLAAWAKNVGATDETVDTMLQLISAYPDLVTDNQHSWREIEVLAIGGTQ